MNNEWVNIPEAIRQKKEALEKEIVSILIDKHGKSHSKRIKDGVNQVLLFWEETDGRPEQCKQFCLEHFESKPKKLNILFTKLLYYVENYFGLMGELNRVLDTPTSLDTGSITAVDKMFYELDATGHYNENMFRLKIAFIVLLNFTFYKLNKLVNIMNKLTEKQWAEIRLAEMFANRAPIAIEQAVTKVITRADIYIDSYNIYLGKIKWRGKHIFGGKDSLEKYQSHWGLRDLLKRQYNTRYGLNKQKMIYQVMLHIINQTIPAIVINNPKIIWNITDNTITNISGIKTLNSEFENNTRYQYLLDIFNAKKVEDAYYEMTVLERSFEDEKEITQKDVEKLIIELLSSPIKKDVIDVMRQYLGRKLEPFDIWYEGFDISSQYTIKQLDKITKEKFPTIEVFSSEIVNILIKLGFSTELSQTISENIIVDPARGSGHAYPPSWKAGKPHLRVRFYKDGLDYINYKTAIHELGHCVEMYLSINLSKYFTLASIPNTAFSEAFAFLFEEQCLPLLGLNWKEENEKNLYTLNTFLQVFEIGAVGLLDIRVWEAMYKNAGMSAGELKQTVIQIAVDIWNQFFAPFFKIKDSPILAIYSHMIHMPLYLPDYFIGIITRWQIEEFIQNKDLHKEMIRMCSIGKVTPQIWMKRAVGADISPKPLIKATEQAIKNLKQKKSA